MAAGEADAFSQLFNAYWNKVYATALAFIKSSQLAEDTAQEVFMRLWQNRDKATEIDNLDGFLFITTRNYIFNKLSRIKLEEAYNNYLQHQLLHFSNGPEILAEERELKEIIEAGIRELPPQQQKAFRLSREKGCSHEEIAQQLGVSKASVKDYIVKALAFLRKYLQEHAALLTSLYLFISQKK
jgi:RNA polymerase sigma-70 factor (ECF subfamily)